MSKKLMIIVLLSWVLALAGCAGLIRQIDQGDRIVLSKDEALVFGKIIFIENNEEKIPYRFWRKPQPNLFQIESGKGLFWKTQADYDKDGAFYWIVPRGSYVITEFQFSYSFQPQVAFWVPTEGDAFYLGALRINATTRKMLAAIALKQVTGTIVADEFEEAKETFLARNPGLSLKIEKSLMVHDESIPVDSEYYEKQALWDLLYTIAMGLRPVR
jgi:hypothetical protein